MDAHSLIHHVYSPTGCSPKWHMGREAAEGRPVPNSSVSVYLRLQEATEQLLKVNVQWGMCKYEAWDWERDLKTETEWGTHTHTEGRMSQRIRGNRLMSDRRRGAGKIIIPDRVRWIEPPISVTATCLNLNRGVFCLRRDKSLNLDLKVSSWTETALAKL